MKIAHKYRGLVWLALLFVLLPFATWRYALRDTVRAVFDCRRLSREVRTHAQSAERVSDTEPLAAASCFRCCCPKPPDTRSR